MNVLFTRASEITGGVQVTDEAGEVRSVLGRNRRDCVVVAAAVLLLWVWSAAISLLCAGGVFGG